MKNFVMVIVFIFGWGLVKSQSIYFPPLVGDHWETTTPTSLNWNMEAIGELYDYLGENNSKAFILLKDGKIVMEKYFGTFTKDSAWYWASAGKTLTSFMVGMAQQEGLLSINDTVSKYLGTGWTSCTPEQEEKITIRHQLTMTTGLDDRVPDNHCTMSSCLKYLAEPGTRWAYHNAPYTLLDKVLTNATSQSLNQYVTRNLSLSTAITGLFLPVGYNNVFFSKPRSMARFGLLILNRGNWNGNQIMTETTYFSEMINTSQQLNKSYGYLWWLNGKQSFMLPSLQVVFPGSLTPKAPEDMFLAAGKNGQLLNIVPSQNLLWLRMGDTPEAGDISLTLNNAIWEKLSRIMDTSTNALHPINDEHEIKVYAKHGTRSVSVDISSEMLLQGARIEIFNINGAKVVSELNTSNHNIIYLNKHPDGVYLVKVTANKKTVVRKVWVQK
jgi:CubicO group peptidase (beta-lactamase class C family)